ncbi:MAG: hypothetical protein ACE5HE_14805 [Phycisphaerae bacterium]
MRAWAPPPQIQWADLLTEPTQEIEDAYRILPPKPTKGLFPAAIGVTRVAVEADPADTSPRRLCLTRDPRNEFLMWNSAFDDQMAVSEVFPIAERDLGGAETDAAQIISANRALKARIALVYAVNESSETKTEMLGALYDTYTAHPLAVLHAQAESVVPPKDAPGPDDLWTTDSKALVRAKFERLVYACIRELIVRDQPPDVETPTGWTPEGPVMPVEWPPRRFRTGS